MSHNFKNKITDGYYYTKFIDFKNNSKIFWKKIINKETLDPFKI